jgi:hypothetical protein
MNSKWKAFLWHFDCWSMQMHIQVELERMSLFWAVIVNFMKRQLHFKHRNHLYKLVAFVLILRTFWITSEPVKIKWSFLCLTLYVTIKLQTMFLNILTDLFISDCQNGHLSKKSSENSKWQTKWCVLFRNLMFYYERENSARPSGRIYIQTENVIFVTMDTYAISRLFL